MNETQRITPAPTRWVVQHEFDHEPTYVSPAHDSAGEFVTLHTGIPAAQRIALAAHIKTFLERTPGISADARPEALPLTRCRDFQGEFNGACPHDVHECGGTCCNGCKAFPDLCSCGSNGQRVRGGSFAAPLAELRFPTMYFCPRTPYRTPQHLVLSFDTDVPADAVNVTTEADLCSAIECTLPATAITVAVFANNRVASAYAEGASGFDDVDYAQVDDPLTGLSYVAFYNRETDEIAIRHEDQREL